MCFPIYFLTWYNILQVEESNHDQALARLPWQGLLNYSGYYIYSANGIYILTCSKNLGMKEKNKDFMQKQ